MNQKREKISNNKKSKERARGREGKDLPGD
jgi:hypothetical protein